MECGRPGKQSYRLPAAGSTTHKDPQLQGSAMCHHARAKDHFPVSMDTTEAGSLLGSTELQSSLFHLFLGLHSDLLPAHGELVMRSDGSLNFSIFPDKHMLNYSYLSICFSKDSNNAGNMGLQAKQSKLHKRRPNSSGLLELEEVTV